MNYKIINDEEAFRSFIEWLPECKPNEQYYMSLLARNKYSPNVKIGSKCQLTRKTSSKEYIFQKVKQMECAIGSYQEKGVDIPQEALALYITVNPRDLWKATLRTAKKMLTNIECNAINSNPQAEAMSEIQNCAGERKYIVFDLDSKEEGVLQKALSICENKCAVIETRGGYHILVKKDETKSLPKDWHPRLAEICDVNGDELSPVVGCIQGGFIPKLILR